MRTLHAQLRAEVAKVIIGQDQVIEELLIAILSRGHALLMGVPGLAKTTMVHALAEVMSLDFNRIQFTPDLMPSDITGTDILQEADQPGKRAFVFIKGPLFANIVLADEINRAPQKTQSALLEAMQERQVTIGDETHPLPDPFLVLATQNPIEQEGTYPLPEAQLDRFLLEIDVGYPDRAAERRILLETTGAAEHRPQAVMDTEGLLSAQRLVRRLPVGEAVVDAILDLVRAARPVGGDAAIADKLLWGPGPRASQALMLGARARALLQGRLSPSIDDVADLVSPVFRHRMALNFTARAEGHTVESAIARLRDTLA